MYKGKIFSNNEKFSKKNPLSIITQLNELGVQELILLDLFRVGQKLGGIPPLFKEIQKNTSCSILIGGGIKDIKDLTDLNNNKFSGALIATALYDGTLKVEELKYFFD